MSIDYLKIVVTIILAVIGWIIGHHFTRKRDVMSKKREITLDHLINAYRILTHDITRRPETKERNEKLEAIISDIQLFGSEEQIELVKELVDTVVAGGEFRLDLLTNNLRNDLRKQIGLKPAKGNVKWLRFEENTSANTMQPPTG